jgi:hypothetical protein
MLSPTKIQFPSAISQGQTESGHLQGIANEPTGCLPPAPDKSRFCPPAGWTKFSLAEGMCNFVNIMGAIE